MQEQNMFVLMFFTWDEPTRIACTRLPTVEIIIHALVSIMAIIIVGIRMLCIVVGEHQRAAAAIFL